MNRGEGVNNKSGEKKNVARWRNTVFQNKREMSFQKREYSRIREK